MADIEHEGKILDINVEETTRRILEAGGKPGGDYTFRRYVFNTVPAQESVWARLRSNGKKTTLTVKEIQHDGIDGTLEWEIEVSDFDKALAILKKCGLSPKGYQENRRVEFTLKNAALSIDYWPRLNPYLEIEAADKAAVEDISMQLGFQKDQLIGDNTMKLYARQGIDLNRVADLRF